MMMKAYFRLACVLGLFHLSAAAHSRPTGPDNDTIKKVKAVDLAAIALTDDPFVARLDSLMNFSFFGQEEEIQATEEFLDTAETKTAYTLPDFHDTIYQQRLNKLNAATPFKLDYNPDVRRYIDVYSKHRREQVSRMLGLAEYYFPLFEETLDRYNLPLELKYLAIVESALNPLARSRVGATGLWQFMFSTGKLNGLKVSSYIDERSDPIKSTEAACQYLSQLYGIFDDWNLALAAYNSGPGNVSRAIRRSGGKQTYWEIRPYLPRETRGYVPAFIAVNYIMNHAEDHFIFPSELKMSYFQTDTIAIREQLSFQQIQDLVGISEEELEFLNPAYRYKIIPKREDDLYTLVLPSSKMGLFIANEDSIYSLALKDFEQQKAKTPVYTEVSDRVTHRVKRGEVLGVIAEKYGVSVSSIRRWNGLRGNTIRVGQRLTIHPRKMPTASSSKSSAPQVSKPKKSEDGKEYVTYKVRNGDSFYSIAKHYPGISAENIMQWNSIKSARSLKPGMNLKIYSKI